MSAYATGIYLAVRLQVEVEPYIPYKTEQGYRIMFLYTVTGPLAAPWPALVEARCLCSFDQAHVHVAPVWYPVSVSTSCGPNTHPSLAILTYPTLSTSGLLSVL